MSRNFKRGLKYLPDRTSMKKGLRGSFFEGKKILLVAAHPDDIESGCGGAIAKYSEFNTVESLVFAPCLEDPENKGIMGELRGAMKALGIGRITKYDLPRDILEESIQTIRDKLYAVKLKFDPDIVFCPSHGDLHQDHRAVAQSCMTIFRDSATLLMFELVRSTIDFNPILYISLPDEIMKRKLQALRCYHTQYRRIYFKPAIFRALARFRGSQINVKYAEAFEIMRMTDT